MLFRNKDMTWKSVSDFTLEKCNESLMDSFIEDIDLDEIIPREKELSSAVRAEISSINYAKLFVDYFCKAIENSIKNICSDSRTDLLYLFRNDSAVLKKLYTCYTHTYHALMERGGREKKAPGIACLGMEDFSRVIDVLISYRLLR